jgi:hypothetical protein
MPTNDFLKFSETDIVTNLLTQAEYLADTQRLIGNQPGIARSKLVNKALRQSSLITSSVAQLIADVAGQDVLDTGANTEILKDLLASLLMAGYAVDNGIANAYSISMLPALTVLGVGMEFKFIVANANTSAATLSVNGLTPVAITKGGSTPLSAGDLPLGGLAKVVYDGVQFQIVASPASPGAAGGGADKVFYENDATITTSYTIGQAGLISGATVTIATPGVVTLTGHGFIAGSQVFFKTTGALPTGLLVDTGYWVIANGLTANTFQLSLTQGGVAINTTGTQSGTHSCGKLKNATSAGTVTIATGVTVTIPTNATWSIG